MDNLVNLFERRRNLVGDDVTVLATYMKMLNDISQSDERNSIWYRLADKSLSGVSAGAFVDFQRYKIAIETNYEVDDYMYKFFACIYEDNFNYDYRVLFSFASIYGNCGVDIFNYCLLWRGCGNRFADAIAGYLDAFISGSCYRFTDLCSSFRLTYNQYYGNDDNWHTFMINQCDSYINMNCSEPYNKHLVGSMTQYVSRKATSFKDFVYYNYNSNPVLLSSLINLYIESVCSSIGLDYTYCQNYYVGSNCSADECSNSVSNFIDYIKSNSNGVNNPMLNFLLCGLKTLDELADGFECALGNAGQSIEYYFVVIICFELNCLSMSFSDTRIGNINENLIRFIQSNQFSTKYMCVKTAIDLIPVMFDCTFTADCQSNINIVTCLSGMAEQLICQEQEVHYGNGSKLFAKR